MRYKELVSKKLENLENTLGAIHSLLSQPNLTQEQLQRWYESCKSKLDEIQTLINSEHQDY